jgi:predicted amidophosphoribosyltransferase
MPPGQLHTPGCRCGDELYQNHSLPWLEARTLGSYQGILRSACLVGKKNHGSWANRQLAIHWLAMHKKWMMDQKPLWVVPIPRHWSRRWLVGHDPAESLARELTRRASDADIRLAPLLLRSKATPHLAQLNSKERFETMRKGFECRKNTRDLLQKISSVLLVDDILTTGATAMAATFALREAGAGKIFVASMARTLEKVN